MAKRKLTPEQEKEIKLLQANNEMYERTKEEAKIRGTKESLERIIVAQEEVQNKINAIMNGTIEKIEIPQEKEEVKPVVIEHKPIPSVEQEPESVFAVLEKHKRKEKENAEEIKEAEPKFEPKEVEYGGEIVNPTNSTFNNIDSFAQYDVITLPSNGECYKSKLGRVPVAYLTAYDENMITSPNLYRDGLVIDYLLKSKVVNKEIDVNELVSGDVDAIMLFLRATSYGADFPVTVEDPDTGEIIESVVDLSKIKVKDFKLKGDENGHFSFTLPLSKAEIKFKYLTRREENDLRLLSKLEKEGSSSEELRAVIRSLTDISSENSIFDANDKSYILDTTRRLEGLAKKIEAVNDNKFFKMVTNRLEMQIVSVNGNSDREYVRKFIYAMPAKDSLELRRYIIENEPGLDFEVEIVRPESLGGGSFKTFLQWNDSIFLNIP